MTLKVVIGASDDPELAQFLENWAKTHPVDPRRDMEAAAGPTAQGTAQGNRGMIGVEELVRRFAELDRAELSRWIERRWIVPEARREADRGSLAVSRGRYRPRRIDPRYPPRIHR